jgi:predicted DNA-binding protein (UPF0251 family)
MGVWVEAEMIWLPGTGWHRTMTIRGAAKFLGVSKQRVHELVREGRLPVARALAAEVVRGIPVDALESLRKAR